MSWAWSFDIDRYLNRIVPPPPWNHVPRPVAHFLGHRKEKPREFGNLRPIFWAFIGIFCALSVIQVASKHVPAFQDRNAPLIIGSFVSTRPSSSHLNVICFISKGALPASLGEGGCGDDDMSKAMATGGWWRWCYYSITTGAVLTLMHQGAAAVLEFYAIESPLAQPRNAIVGQVLSSLVGVSVAKLFQLSDRFDEIRWVAGALSCAAATALMALTKTVHPPAGATALLAVANQDVTQLGWFLLPVMLLGLALMLAVALIINNIERQFPIYWWTPENLRRGAGSGDDQMLERKHTHVSEHGTDKTESTLEGDLEAGRGTGDSEGEGEAKRQGQRRSSQRSHSHGHGHGRDASPATTATAAEGNEIIIRPGHVVIPDHLFLRQEEVQYLETLSQRL
ncbi:HPP family protein [Paramyrothecium foliicola]|nr:HPP family protein [Paramyrothecium foliicola]